MKQDFLTELRVLGLRAAEPKSFRKVDEVVKLAKKKGKLTIFTHEAMCFNMLSGDDALEPKKDGTFDHMGYDATDVNSYYLFKWWKLDNFKILLKSIPTYLNDIKEFVVDGFTSRDLEENKRRFKTWVINFNPFKVETSSWVWVADSLSSSLKSTAWEVAEDDLAKEAGFIGSEDMYGRTGRILNNIHVKDIADDLLKNNRERIMNEMVRRDGLVNITPILWVSENDPTCFVLDEAAFPFQLKNGWDDKGLAEVIGYWVQTFYGVNIPVEMKEEKNED